MEAKGRWWRPLRGATLGRRMTLMLLGIVLQGGLFSGMIIAVGTLYLQSFNAILNDCYAINRLLGAYTAEADAFGAYMLDASESAYAGYLACRGQGNDALQGVHIQYEDSVEQFLLLQAIRTSYESFHAACDETMLSRLTTGSYADAYDRALRIGANIEGYIKSLLQDAIETGQAIYQHNAVRFRLLPSLFLLSIGLSLVSIALWTRWMLRRVVRPLNALIDATGAMRANRYDGPDLMVEADDEISQLAQVFNEMKHSTAALVESLKARREVESRLHTEEMRRVTMEQAMDTLRLSLLQSQINPHFLFNTLNIISRMAQMEDAPKTEDLILRLANLFRYNLQSVDDVVPLRSELRIVEDYIAIQRIRFGERMAFELRCEPDPDAYTVPAFTLQPLIENAVIHGISHMEDGGRVSVDISEAGGTLAIAVSDTGVGMSPEQVEALLRGDPAAPGHVTGLGVGNVRRRIEGHYPGSRFTIDSAPGMGTRILITIPTQIKPQEASISL
ncbi:sensor histidine kinase [Eubacteriales bacterium OttesenSCG-928-A19]|nr:sensor histidine kinase [Eubacteriales bacterium OttesenSCG-928-A19]